MTQSALAKQFNFDKLPLLWRDQSPIKTFFDNALSCMIPAYEAFLLKTLTEVKNFLMGDDLAKLNHFLLEENAHTVAHVQFNQALKKSGIDVDQYEQLARVTINKFAALPINSRLMLVALMESMSSVLSDKFLREFSVENIFLPAKNLFVWHSIEEMEHRSEAFRVYQALRTEKLNNCIMLSFYFSTAFMISKIIFLQLKRHNCFLRLKTFTDMCWLLSVKGPVISTLKGVMNFRKKNYCPDKYFFSQEQENFIAEWKISQC